MTQALAKPTEAEAIEQALVAGDLSRLTPAQRVLYYHNVCASLGINSLTRPFDYLVLNGKLVLYARKDCTDQLRTLRKVSITGLEREQIGDLLVVTASARAADGRTDSSIGAVNAKDLRGENLANAMMKAETKAKRRVTLSLCGLGMLDESEVDSIPGMELVPPQADMVTRGNDPVWQRYLELVVELEGEDVGTIERLSLPVSREELITAGKGIKAMIAERKREAVPAF